MGLNRFPKNSNIEGMKNLKYLLLLSIGVGLGVLAVRGSKPSASKRKSNGRSRGEDLLDEVNQTSEDSFPASDPPAWNVTTASPPNKNLH